MTHACWARRGRLTLDGVGDLFARTVSVSIAVRSSCSREPRLPRHRLDCGVVAIACCLGEIMRTHHNASPIAMSAATAGRVTSLASTCKDLKC
jgi:hypothetical protein